jgi:glucose-6-phosphate dehydrogenase assembly protein OpcA
MEEAVSDSPGQVLARIDREVRAFWSVPPPPGETPTARACTTNLIVVTATPELASRWVATVDEVLKSLPARALVVGLDPDGDESLEAQTTQVCAPSAGGGPAVCSERVTLHARGAVCARVASIIDSLCVNDVPRTLVWLGRVHADDLVFGPLAASVDRIVLDTSQTATHGTLSDLAHAVRWAKALDASARPGIADLAWTRLAPWQEMCARMFDEPRLRSLAGKVSRVRMVQSSPEGAALGSEGGLILGWLATQLGWKAVSLAGKLRLLRADEGSVRTQLRAEATHQAPPGSLLAVEVEATDGPLSILGSIRRDPNEADAALWRLDVKGAGGDAQHLEQRVRLRAAEPARLLERTLHRPPHDGALTESIEWAEGLHGEELVCG